MKFSDFLMLLAVILLVISGSGFGTWMAFGIGFSYYLFLRGIDNQLDKK
jgi:hypothetical protein